MEIIKSELKQALLLNYYSSIYILYTYVLKRYKYNICYKYLNLS